MSVGISQVNFDAQVSHLLVDNLNSKLYFESINREKGAEKKLVNSVLLSCSFFFWILRLSYKHSTLVFHQGLILELSCAIKICRLNFVDSNYVTKHNYAKFFIRLNLN